MRKVSNKSRSDSSGKSFFEVRDADGTIANNEAWKLIKVVNSKIKLLSILKRYGIVLKHGSGNWSQPITCPFPFHKSGNESTASLGYNFSSDYFNCFGCGASGQAVEFISFTSGVSKIIVAERLFTEVSGYDFHDVIEEDQNPKIEKALFEFASFIQDIICRYKSESDVLEQVEKITWWFDIYLLSKSPHNKIFVNEIEARILKAKELLEDL